ncbi:PH domain-containing protein [Psychroflexus maritimus]|uniref:PH domain-containing protein n=1 Tax=Psychroflexus maritimus TaxID=2714865 RepID=A0A967ACW4_9FLAO|nr:PH domain-containing protein [Psychroflexus maritimus]NGZ88978.1 PH domain-containing protein [Psychroflexus maritimus]
MKDYDFSKAQLQDFRGVFIIFFANVVQKIRRYFFAFFVPLLNANFRAFIFNYFILAIFIVVAFSFGYAYLLYIKFKFQIKGQSFHLNQGVIKRSSIEIPFERIQNINIEQNIFQRFLNVVGFQVETAGEGTAEINIKALRREKAVALKNQLLEDVKKVNPEVELTHTHSPEVEYSSSSKPANELMELDFISLFKVGVSSNFLKGLSLLLLFISTLFNFFFDVLSHFLTIDFEEDFFNRIPETLTFAFIFIAFLLFLGFLITVLSVMVKYFGLRVVRLRNNFEVEYGLIKRVNQVIKKNKTQVVEIDTNPIKKWLNIQNLFVSQASSVSLTNAQKIGLVGITPSQTNIFFEAIFDRPRSQLFTYIRSSLRYIIRLFWRQSVVFTIAFLVGQYFLGWVHSSIIAFFIAFILGVVNYLAYRKSYVGVSKDLIKIGGGSINTSTKYLALYKVQSVFIKRTIFQQFNAHADLVIYTASGREVINYLPYQQAIQIQNYILYRLERSSESWI